MVYKSISLSLILSPNQFMIKRYSIVYYELKFRFRVGLYDSSLYGSTFSLSLFSHQQNENETISCQTSLSIIIRADQKNRRLDQWMYLWVYLRKVELVVNEGTQQCGLPPHGTRNTERRNMQQAIIIPQIQMTIMIRGALVNNAMGRRRLILFLISTGSEESVRG